MRFSGQLQLPDEPDPGLRVVLQVTNDRVVVTSGSAQLGAWDLDEVAVAYLDPDRFSITVAGDRTTFLPDDPVRFAYEGMAYFDRARAASGTLGRLWTWLTEQQPIPDDQPEPFEPSASTLTLVWERPTEDDLLVDLAAVETEPRTPRVCSALRKDGMPCRAEILLPSGLCASHDPDRPKTDRRAKRMRRLRRELDHLIDRVAAGEIDPAAASAVASLVQAIWALEELDRAGYRSP